MQALILPVITVAVGLYLFGLGCGVRFLPPKALRGRVWLAVIAVFVLLWGGSSVMTAMVSPHSPAQIIAEQLNQQLHPPVNIDPSVRIDSVTSVQNTVVYTMTITDASADPKAMEQNVRNDMKNNACSNQDYQSVFRIGGSMQMVFKDANANVIDTLTITPADCNVSTAPQ